MEDNSVDSIITDPPYGISFMNNNWDYSIPTIDIWKECLIKNPPLKRVRGLFDFRSPVPGWNT